jgi:hypothetical protein
MRRILKWAVRALAYTASVLITLALLVVIYAFIVNSFDEPLTPQAKALLAEPPHTLRPEDNLYVAMMGFQAPAGESPTTAGQQRIERYNATLDRMLLDPDGALVTAMGDEAGKLQISAGLKPWMPLSSSLWEAAKTHHTEIHQLLLDNTVLMERYRKLPAFHGYDETARPSYMEPAAYPSQQIRALFLADVAYRLQTSAAAQQRIALEDLASDLGMWRTVLTGQGGLLSKMLAAAAVRADDLLLADWIADPATDLPAFDTRLAPLIQPFDTTDWRLGKAFASEFRGTDTLYRIIPLANSPIEGSTARPASWWVRQRNVVQAHFFKLHATENQLAERMTQVTTLLDADPAHLEEARATYEAWNSQKSTSHGLAIFYNPVGQILASIATPAYDNHALRVSDTASLQRLLTCELEIRRQHLTATNVPAFLIQHPEWCSHVVPGHPFVWDPIKHELTVIPLGKHNPAHRWSVALKFL